MPEAATTQIQKKSWRPLLWGLAAFLIVPQLPILELMVPISQSVVLLVPIVAVCAMLGWKVGGRAALAVVLLALSAWILVQPVGLPGTPYDQMARGWVILLAASFGLLSILWSSVTPFFVRALSSVAVATVIAFTIALGTPSGIARFQHAAGAELTRRASATIAQIEQGMATPESRQLAARVPAFEAWNEASETMMREMPDKTANLLPALLALESLAALALGWGVYDRLSPIKIGPTLGPLTEFRFNDQLVWGVAVGATLCLLPAFAEGRNAGLNLLIFFGGLYVVRGLGVLGWIARGRYPVIIILILIPVWAMLGVLALALGLGDTWLDLRRRARPG
jgi:hypothetical protein